MCKSVPSGKKSSSSSWGHNKIYTPGTIANLYTETAPTKTNKNGAVVKVRILTEN